MKNLLIIFFMLSSISCIQDKKCDLPAQIIGSGEIVSNALVDQPLINWEISKFEHVIQTDSQNVFNLKVSFDNGATYGTINFNQYTLLGKYASGGCQVVYEREVSKIDVAKKCFYKIKVHQCGTCEKYSESMNWVLVSKIPKDYSVSFIVEKK